MTWGFLTWVHWINLIPRLGDTIVAIRGFLRMVSSMVLRLTPCEVIFKVKNHSSRSNHIFSLFQGFYAFIVNNKVCRASNIFNISLRWPKSSEHFSHWLTVDFLYVAPLADRVFDNWDGRGVLNHFYSCSFPIMPGFVLAVLLLCGKGVRFFMPAIHAPRF